MPANLTPDYREAEKRWREASTPEDKLVALQEMLRTIPKHKGTEKLQGDIKKRIAQTRDRMETQQRSGAKRRPDWVVDRQGSGQVVVLGPANSGKSSLVGALTSADPDVGDYPFTTAMPYPAMMQYKNVQIQLVDLPPLHLEMSPTWLQEVVRGTDGVLLVLDLSDDDLLALTEAALAYLAERDIHLCPPEFLEQVDAFIGSSEPTVSQHTYPALIAANKFEDDEADLRLELLAEMWEENGLPRLPLLRVSTHMEKNLEKLRSQIWQMLGKLRVYTRPPGHDPDLTAPFVLDHGATALDLAYAIHKDIGASFKYAKVWGEKTFDAQKVGRDYVLHDGDILEIHGS